jgi:GT2 family glycosyltransferase
VVVLYHQNNTITKVIAPQNEIVIIEKGKSIAYGVLALANQFPKAKIVWCHEQLHKNLNLKGIKTLFHHDKMMLSFSAFENSFLGSEIGFVEESPFIKVNKKINYPTWLMSSEVGVIHASVLNLIGNKIKTDGDFDYFLNSVAKVGMPLGLLCYSEPNLVLQKTEGIPTKKSNLFVLFRFVKQHYRSRWVVLLFLNLVIYEKRFPLLPFVCSLGYKNRKKTGLNLDSILVQSTLAVVGNKTIDVIIPTIGRKLYLYDVLKDLALQTHLPVNVIIVEQNPLADSVSVLDYLSSEKWPFTIKHTFTHQAGACNARNLALSKVESEWIFLSDDDIRFEDTLLENALCKIQQFGVSVITTVCLQKNESQRYSIANQSGIFGSGNSFVKTSCLAKIAFDMALEFGYGEDTDFGLQLRNQGYDVIYFPDLKIIHLKAPMGGFRIKVKLFWENEVIQPKPSPTVMYVLLKYYTTQQLCSYKLVLFLKLLKKESIRNYFNFFKTFQKKWKVSQHWANKI